MRDGLGPSRVYLIGADGTANVKIGQSVDPAARMTQIQANSPLALRFLWLAEGGRGLETYLHLHFEDRHQHGEWFALGSDAVALVQAAAEEFAERAGAPLLILPIPPEPTLPKLWVRTRRSPQAKTLQRRQAA